MKKIFLLLQCLSFLCYAQDFDLQFSRVDEKPTVINIYKEMPTLETHRLILRPIVMEDAQDLLEVHRDQDVVKYMPLDEDTLEKTQKALAWRIQRQKEGNPVPWVMVDKKTGKVLGFCGFYRIDYPRAAGEIMVTLNRAFWGHGYMQEAMTKVADYGFTTIGLNRIDVLFYPENKRIISLCSKAGLQFIGRIPECYYYKGRYWDRLFYILLKKDWSNLKSKL